MNTTLEAMPETIDAQSEENAPAFVAVETVKRLDTDGFRDAAERIRAEAGELLPGVEYSEGGDASFPVLPARCQAEELEGLTRCSGLSEPAGTVLRVLCHPLTTQTGY